MFFEILLFKRIQKTAKKVNLVLQESKVKVSMNKKKINFMGIFITP